MDSSRLFPAVNHVQQSRQQPPTSLEETTPAQDDATYKVTFENNGEVTFTTSNLTDGTPSASSD